MRNPYPLRVPAHRVWCCSDISANMGVHSKLLQTMEPISQHKKRSSIWRTHLIYVSTLVPPHRPQRQEKVERANRILKSILKKYVWEYITDWGMLLPSALFAMRTMLKIGGAYSPFVLTCGRPPRFSALENEDQLYYEETVEEAIMKRISELVELNRNVIPEARSKMSL